MKINRCYHLMLVGLLTAGTASAYEVAFENNSWCTNGVEVLGYDQDNVPQGWVAAPTSWKTTSGSTVSFLHYERTGPSKTSNPPALRFNSYNAKKGETGDLVMGTDVCVPREEVVCDTIAANLMLYVYPFAKGKSIDTIQLIATTNDWESCVELGDPIPIRDESYTEGWRSFPVVDTFNGVSLLGADKCLRIGVRVVAGGGSTSYVYLHSFSVKFVACATPDKPVLVSAGLDDPDITRPLDLELAPGVEHGRMAVRVKVSPKDKIGELKVFGVLTRNNGMVPVITNELVEISDGIYCESIEKARARKWFDAGEEISVSVFTQYKSTDPAVSPLGEPGVGGLAYEFSTSDVYSVGKNGSVWINELGIDVDSQCYVELCGTTNRSYRSGWQVVLSGVDKGGTLKAYTNNLVNTFDFSTNMVNGVVGIETHRWMELDDVELKNATIELINSAGVVESSGIGISFPAHYQMTGKAKWHGKDNDDWSYDWSGTATDGTFTFGQTSEVVSFGRVNKGQGFLVPVGTTLYFTTLIEGKGEMPDPLPYASVSATVDGILNGEEGTTNFVEQTDSNGTANIKIAGYSDDASRVSLVISVSAFAWKCDDVSTNISLYAESVALTNFASSTIAYDDFSKLRDYWKNESDFRNNQKQTQYWGIVESAAQLDTRNGDKGSASLTTKSYMALRGKKWLDVSFDFKNDRDYGVMTDIAKLTIILADTADVLSGSKLETVALANKSKNYKTGEWFSVREVMGVPADFAKDGKVWIRVYATKTVGTTSAYTTLDNLRIAALDSVKINEFKMGEPTGVAFPQELSSDVELDISPLTGGIVSNFVEEVLTSVETNYVRKVAADLVLTINGTEFAVPFSFADGNLTNDVSAAEENVKLTIAPSTITKMTGGFLPGDEVQYYVRVTYDPDDADDSGERDARYYPDNATPTANGWRVENGYAPVVQSLSITDKPALTLVGKPETTTNGVRFTVHGYSANMLSEVSIYINGEKCAEQPFNYLGTNNQIRVTGEFVIEMGLNASTTYTVTIKGKDGTGAELQEATFTFLTKPKLPDISGAPEDGAYSPTKAFDFYALAEADDVANLNFHWLLDETAVVTPAVPTNYHDSVANDGPHTVRVYVTDQESNVSPTNSLSWVVDTTKPTKPDIAGTPANGSVTNGVAYDLTAKSTDATLITYHWLMDGVAASTATNFTGAVAPGFASHEVQCYATDQAGNVSETNDWAWTVDTLKPQNLKLSGLPIDPEKIIVTNGFDFAFKASAEDDTELTYHWTTNDVAETDCTAADFAGKVGEGTNTVSVYAKDEAGNVSVTNSAMWVVDTIAPTEPTIGGDDKPSKVTRSRSFSLTASSEDATKITYHWTLKRGEDTASTGDEPTFAKSGLDDGVYTVSVYATDEAMNVSPTNHYNWTIDNIAPEGLAITGTPTETPFVTTVTNVDLTASATDKVTPPEDLRYIWDFNDEKGVEGANLMRTALEGTNTATFCVSDAAGNESRMSRTWVVDTIAPTDLIIKGWPGNEKTHAYTNEARFAYTATAMDDTRQTFHWKFDDHEEIAKNAGATFSETDFEPFAPGEHTVSVYVTDEAENVSATNSVSWTYDVMPPAVTNLTSTTPDPFGKGTEFLEVEVAFSEPVVGFGTHSVFVDNRAEVASVEPTGKKDGTFYLVRIRPGDDGLITVKIEGEQVKDRAGNWNEASGMLTHTYDTTPPADYTFESTPENEKVVATSNFNFKVSATDTTTVTYHWKTNAADYVSLGAEKKEGAWVAEFEGLASEGTNTLSVYGTDQLGNPTETNSIWWVVDTFAPTNLVITGWPANGAYTNETAFSLKAEAMDATQLTYHWTLKRGEDTASTWEGQTFSSKSKLDDGDYTVMCYAEDEAHNVSATTDWTWTVDTVHPTVELSSSTPTTFNEYKVPLIVDVTFGEAVTGFDGDCVTVTRGVVTNWTGSGSSYTVYIDPDDEEEHEAFVPLTVTIAAKEVRDLAGNPNEASNELQFRNVTKLPTVTLATETREPFKDLPFVVTATFVRGKTAEAAVVTNFTAESVSITNGTVTVWPGFATNVYTITITPKPDSVVTVLIPEGVVADDVGNQNVASTPLVRTYDVSKPANLRFLDSSTPAEGEVTASRRFDFEVAADDMTALTYTWELNGKLADCTSSNFVSTADVPKGTNIVSVFATDAAGNFCDPITRTWIVDYIAPTNFAVTGTPGVMGEIVITNGTFFSYVADATDDTRITYCWTTNGVEVADNPTNLVGTAIETTNTVTCYAMDQAKNVSETNTIVWVVDTIPPKLGELSGTPDVGKVVATNGFAFATSAEDATALTYHWTLNGELVGCTTSNYVDAAAVEGTNTLQVWAEDAAGNVSKTTNTTWWVVDRIAPTVPELSGAPADGAITNGTGYGFTATSTDDHLDAYYWSLDGKAAPPALPGKMFEGNVAEGYATHSVEVYATDKAGNKSVPTNWTWTVDTVSPTNLVITGIPPAVTNVAAFTMTASALDDTAISYHWLTNGIEVVSTNLDVRATEGTNTVQVWAEDAAHNVSTTNTIRWVLDTIAPTKPVIDGEPTDGAITKDTGFWLTASSVDKTGLTFWWKRDGKAVKALPSGEPFTNDEDLEDGEHVVSVYATDEAGNVSEDESSIRWTVDTTAPKMPVIVDAFPASNSFVNVTNYSFKAAEPKGEEDATAVTFLWRIEGGDLDGKKDAPVTNFTGEVGMDGAYTAFVYAKDAAGNISPTNNLSWTVDTQIPTNLVISGWPANGSLTNGPNYCLTATADDATTLTFHWTISDAAGVSDLSKDEPFKGTVADGTHTVSCYATDAAQNRSATKFWSWTSDTTGPTNLVLSVGTPSEGAVVATNGYDFTASAMDLTEIEYSWTLNGNKSENTTSNFVGTAAREGTNTLSVTATDAAGNSSEETRTRTWVVDTFAPTNLVVSGTPGDGALTNGTFFSWTASAQDATRLKYHWSLLTNGVEAVNEIVTNEFSDVAVEGTNTVTVYAKDEAGNVSATTNVCWTVDLTLPTVTLSTEPELPAGKVINLEDIKSNGFMVHVMFSEPVAGFTTASVTITNGNGEVTAVATNSASSYTVWVMPAHDGLVPLQIADGAVKDLAGNGNVASDVLERTCDITPPKVTSITSNRNEPYGYLDELDGEPLKFTLLFSEAITNFTSASITVTNGNGTVTEVVTNSALSYTVTVDFVSDGRIPVMVAAGAVTDLAGNDNEASDVLTRTRDTTDPELIITGTPEEGDITSAGTYDLTAQATDLTELSYLWVINDEVQEDVLGNRLNGTLTGEGEYLVEVWVFDAAGNFAYDTRSWTYEKGDVPSGIDFGESVQLKITDPSVTNVEFSAVDFQPGKESTFALREFQLKGSQETTKEITDLKMWFIVGTNLLDDIRWDVKVDEDAKFDNGTLTVTIPGEGTTDENTGKPYESFFIFKIDNKE